MDSVENGMQDAFNQIREAQTAFEGFWQNLLQDPKLRECLIYCCFVVVFTFVVFAAKPGKSQYFVTEMALQKYWYAKLSNVGDVRSMYEYLHDMMPDFVYPQLDYNGASLSDITRMFILGQGRAIGSMRLSQKRSKLVECDAIPKWLRDIGAYESKCTSKFTMSNAEKRPFAETAEYAFDEGGTLGNFTQPFAYRSASDLNSSDVTYERGYFGAFYPQGGYTLDLVPNLAPQWYAARVQACMPLLQASIEECRVAQGVDPDVVYAPPSPPESVSPPPPVQMGNDVEAGMVVTTAGAISFLSALDKNFNLDGVDKTSERFTFTLHNPGAVTLNWEFDNETFTYLDQGLVPWITGVTPMAGNPVSPIESTDCTFNTCPGLIFTVQVQRDAWMLAQVNNGTIGRTVAHPMPEFTINLQSPDFTNLRVSVSLRMTYTIPPLTNVGNGTAPARRALQQAAAPEPPQSTICSERLELKTGFYQLNDLVVHSRMDQSKCVIIEDVNRQCELKHFGFQFLLEEARIERCGECKCKPGKDAFCLENCSPRRMYLRQLEHLKMHQWTDRQTRAVVMDVALLHQNSNLFQVVRFMFEYWESGGFSGGPYVRPKLVSRVFRLYRYVTSYDYVVAALEFLLVLFTLAYTAAEILAIVKEKWSYWYDAWHWMDWANLVLLYTAIGLRAASVAIINNFDYDSLTVQYVDFYPIGYITTQELNVFAVNFFLIYFKLFKYLNRVPRMGVVFETLRNAMFDLFLFSIMFMVCMFGFAASFYVVFSAEVESCKTLADAFGTLFRVILGDFDYRAFSDANPVLAPFLFYLFILLVVMILINMFLAILADAYMEAKTNQSDEDMEFYRNLRVHLLSSLKDLFKHRDNIRELTKELQGEVMIDGDIDMRELERMLENNPRALQILRAEGAADLMRKYDVNNDGVLDKEEMHEIVRELAEKEAELQDEIDEQAYPGGDADPSKGRVSRVVQKPQQQKQQQLQTQPQRDTVVVSGGPMADTRELEGRIERVDMQIKELSRNVAKKLSLMIDLMMSLSDQITSASRPVAPNNGVDRSISMTTTARNQSNVADNNPRAIMPVIR